MLEHNETVKLLRLAKQGDENAKECLIKENLPLIKSIVKRFRGRLEYEDLMQLGAMGFTKAMLNFNEDYNVRFSTYAVPMITGEIKRYLRDDGTIKVSRYAKTLAHKITKYIEEKQKDKEYEPTVDELANEFECDPSDIVYAMDSAKFVLSLSETAGEDDDTTLGDKITGDISPEEKLDVMMLKDCISALPEKERKVIILRYFRDKTQSEVATELGVSQVQVSRLENKILNKLRGDIE